MTSYIFVLCPPFSGSTVLWKLLASSDNVASLPMEGQFLPEIKQLLEGNSWNEDFDFPWPTVRAAWEKRWEDKPFKIEKSPPHLIRALEIEKLFVPSYFVVMIRDPYAFCEGYSRRLSASMEQSALFWQRCARQQKSNIEKLKHGLFFTYEEFTEDTALIVQQLRSFLPYIGDLNWQGAYHSQSVFGPIEWKISNLNDVKISRLSTDDINEINRVLQSDSSLLSYFNYKLLKGGARHDLWRLRMQAKLQIIENWERAKRVYKRRMDGAPGNVPDR